MRRTELLASLVLIVGLAAGCASQAPSWVQASGARFARQIALPAPSTQGAMSVEQALARRRSMRSFLPDPLPLATLGQLLWAGQGITDTEGKRTAPSAGALYPLELYVVTPRQEMHYLPAEHRVELRHTADLRADLQRGAFGQAPVGAAPDIVVIAADASRTTSKYGARGEAFVDREAGHAAQNILLEAVARGLAAVPIGGFDPSEEAAVLALPPDLTVLYLIPVGRPG